MLCINAGMTNRPANRCEVTFGKPVNFTSCGVGPLQISLTLWEDRDENHIRAVDWAAFLHALRQFPPHNLTIATRIQSDASLRSLLEAMLLISDTPTQMGEIAVSEHAPPFQPDTEGRRWFGHQIFAAPEEYSKDDVTIALAVDERVEWLMRHSAVAQSAYLDGVFTVRNASGPKSTTDYEGGTSGSGKMA